MRLLFSVRIFQNSILLLFFFVILIPSKSFSQQSQTQPQQVIKLLKQIERQFDLSFSYNRRALKDIKCTIPNNLQTKEEVLNALKTNCTLEFYTIDARFIAVRVNSEPAIEVCGTLIDKNTGTPLSNASVVTSFSQISVDNGGKFRITAIPPTEKISVFYEGFKVHEFTAEELVDESDCPIVFIDQEFNYLPTVILNSYLTRGISRNAEGSVNISKSNYEILPNLVEPDVLRIAQILPGIDSFSETAANINIRGGKSDEVLLLWDDIRMYQTGHFFGLISAFNPNLTENVEIYKNGTHPRFGNSVSGVLSMQSDNEIPEQVTGAASIDFISTQFYAKIPASEKFGIHLSGRTSINTGVGNPVYNQFFDRVFQNTVVTNLQTNTSEGLRSTDEAFNFYDINGKAIWELTPKDKLQFNFLTILNKLQFTERFTGDTFLNKNVSELKQNSTVIGFSYERDWTRRLKSKISYNTVNYRNFGANQNIETAAIQSQDNEVDERSFLAEVQFNWSPKFQLSGGYQYTDTDILNAVSPFEFDEIFSTNNSLYSNAAFLNTTLKLNNSSTILSTGIRFTDYPQYSKQFFEPRMNISQKITSVINLTAAGELKHQAIAETIDVQNNLLGIENERWIILGNSISPILESKQVSVGVIYNKIGWNLSLEGFLKEVSQVNSGNLGFRNQLLETNAVGSYNVSGMEASISKKTDYLNVWLSYTFMDNEYMFEALNSERFRSNFDVNHSLSLAASFSWKQFLFSLGTSYHSGIPFTPVIRGNEIVTIDGIPEINFGNVNSGTLNEFLRTDFSAGYKLKLDSTFTGKINLALFNLFNRKNALDSYYLLEFNDDGEAELTQIEEFSLGFTPNISLQLLF